MYDVITGYWSCSLDCSVKVCLPRFSNEKYFFSSKYSYFRSESLSLVLAQERELTIIIWNSFCKDHLFLLHNLFICSIVYFISMDSWVVNFILWSIMQYNFYLFYCSKCFSWNTGNILQTFCSWLLHQFDKPYFCLFGFWLLICLLLFLFLLSGINKQSLSLSYAFHALVLASSISARSSAFFYWNLVFTSLYLNMRYALYHWSVTVVRFKSCFFLTQHSCLNLASWITIKFFRIYTLQWKYDPL